MPIGYNKPLDVLPFGHPATFSNKMFGWQGPLSGGSCPPGRPRPSGLHSPGPGRR